MICHMYQYPSKLHADFNAKITSNAHFSNDLGLDSLDTVEVVMAIEEVCALQQHRLHSFTNDWNRSSASRFQIKRPMQFIAVKT